LRGRCFGRSSGLGRDFRRLDQSFAEPPWGWFRTIATASDRQIGAFPFPLSLLVTIAAVGFASPLSGPLFELRRGRRGRRGRSWRRVDVTRAAVGFASPLPRPIFEPGRGRRSCTGNIRACTQPTYESGRRGRRRSWRQVIRRRRRRTTAIITSRPSLAITTRVAVPVAFPIARARLRLAARGRIAIEVLGLDVRDVEKPVSPYRKIDERSLDGRLEVDNLALVDVARIALVAGSLHVKLFENAVLDDGDPAFFGLKHIDQHFFLHAVSFRD